MRFFLVLVLLGGIACNFHGVLSEQLSGIGNGFFTIGEEKPGDRIQAVKFFLGLFSEFKGIQMKINDQWSEKYGLSGGEPEKFTLWKGESIIKVSGYHNLCIHSITMETNFGRAFTIGESTGQKFTASPPEVGMVLSGIRGLYGAICIKKMSFDWKYAPKKIKHLK
ncbi:prostatic spermine-binding protein-like [Sminthopsis crassicaudata]|uniref:prostatic spermine-binding protein-like n=1 Tax=Sminthopsis crassicaudata TaxID=9301 RepID=UPI003D686F11